MIQKVAHSGSAVDYGVLSVRRGWMLASNQFISIIYLKIIWQGQAQYGQTKQLSDLRYKLLCWLRKIVTWAKSSWVKWVMANNSPASLVVWLSRTGVATLSEKRTIFDSSPAEHFALPPCSTEIIITSDDILKKPSQQNSKTVQLSPCAVVFKSTLCSLSTSVVCSF